MNTPVKKRFWKEVFVSELEGGFGVALDDKPIKTPAKNILLVPTYELATFVADEWINVGEEINPQTLRFTKLCNASIDSMPDKFEAVVEMLSDYADTDLLCHKSESPEGLVLRQTRIWDPVLTWVEQKHGLKFNQTVGILPVAQPPETREVLKSWLNSLNKFEMMACHDLTVMSGSIIVAKAVCDNYLSASEAWEVSRVDEDWQTEQWGVDEEAEKAANIKFDDFFAATKLFKALQS